MTRYPISILSSSTSIRVQSYCHLKVIFHIDFVIFHIASVIFRSSSTLMILSSSATILSSEGHPPYRYCHRVFLLSAQSDQMSHINTIILYIGSVISHIDTVI